MASVSLLPTLKAAQTAPAHAANLLSLLEAEGFSIRFLRAFAESPRPVRRLVVAWLGLGWTGADGTAR
jgi:hypothetical protein